MSLPLSYLSCATQILLKSSSSLRNLFMILAVQCFYIPAGEHVVNRRWLKLDGVCYRYRKFGIE